jgi:hypothetical protein
MIRRIAIIFGLALLSLSLISSCTSVTYTWKEDNYQGNFNKLLVITAAKNQDRRILFEDEFVKQLKEQGTAAVPSHSIIPFDKMTDRETIISNSKGQGIDGVIVVQLTGILDPDPTEVVFLLTSLYDMKAEKRVFYAHSGTEMRTDKLKDMRSYFHTIIVQLFDEKLIKLRP